MCVSIPPVMRQAGFGLRHNSTEISILLRLGLLNRLNGYFLETSRTIAFSNLQKFEPWP
jgi:hypothetical protein